MENLTLNVGEFIQLEDGFQGGYTHANAQYVRRVVKNVASYDFTSSYPAVMLLEEFPMSKSNFIRHRLSDEEFEDLLCDKCCLFDLEIWNLVPKLNNAHPISSSKCSILEDSLIDNGRVVMAEHLKITCTEQDYFVYSEFYDWEDYEISNFRYYDKSYLPKNFALSILELYKRKTILKGVEEEELNYMISKNMLNAAYGMSVTNPVRTQFIYSR